MKTKLLTLAMLPFCLAAFTAIGQLSPGYQKDLSVVRQSQEHALEQAQAMEARATDAHAKALVQAVEQPLLHVIDLMAQRCCDLGQCRDDRAGLGPVADLHARLAREGDKPYGGNAIEARNSSPLFGNRPPTRSSSE